MAGPVTNPDAKTPEAETSSPESRASEISPCERLWARYHIVPEGDKVEILEELIDNGCLERSRRSITGPEVPIS